MAENIQLVKPEGQEWGFRVTGGVDFGTPLTIVKINKDSTAERAGLKVGDMIIAINDQPLAAFTHFQATDVITKAGNMFKVTLIRGSIVQVPHIPIPQIIIENGSAENPKSTTAITTDCPGEQEPLELPTMLANMINTGLQEQEAMEDGSIDNQQTVDADMEVAGSWNFSLPQQLVVTLKSVTPTLDGRPGSPWEIVEEYSTFVDQPDTPDNTSNKPIKIDTEINVPATESGGEVGAVPAGMVETLGGQGTQGQATEGEPQKNKVRGGSGVPDGGQHQSEGGQDGQRTKTEGQGTNEQPAEEHKEYTEDEIAEMMSGCAEVLAGKCMGVDFQKLPPDSDIMKSEVLYALIAERIEYPQKKLTTFQQKPSRPKPKPKGEPEKPREPYLPLKYKGSPKKKEEVPSQEESPAAVEESEATPCPEGGKETEHNTEEMEHNTEETLEGEQTQEHEGQEDASGLETEENAEHTDMTENPEKAQMPQDPAAVNSSDIEAQLAEIQNQLAAIIQLPVEIQQHLSFIQTQLSKILEMRAAAEAKENQEHVEEEPLHEGDEHPEEIETENKEDEEAQDHHATEGQEEMGEGEEQEGMEEMHPEPESEAEPAEPEPEPEPEPPKPKKDIEWKKDDETQKRNKPFFPLTPQPRPVQLPGGRHWFRSRDVYTDDFIAETISGKEEILIGTTIGVDFHKFQSSLEHLKNSSVYKMIHDKEEKRVPGAFVSRAEKVLAKEDYVNP